MLRCIAIVSDGADRSPRCIQGAAESQNVAALSQYRVLKGGTCCVRLLGFCPIFMLFVMVFAGNGLLMSAELVLESVRLSKFLGMSRILANLLRLL